MSPRFPFAGARPLGRFNVGVSDTLKQAKAIAITHIFLDLNELSFYRLQ